MNVTIENILTMNWSEDYDLRERITGDDASLADQHDLDKICGALNDYPNNEAVLTQQRQEARALLRKLANTAEKLSTLINEAGSNKYAWGAILGTFGNNESDKLVAKFHHQEQQVKALSQTFAMAQEKRAYPDSLPPAIGGSEANPAFDELIGNLHYPIQAIIRRTPGSEVRHTEEAEIIIEILQRTNISKQLVAKTIQNRLSALPCTYQDWLIEKVSNAA